MADETALTIGNLGIFGAANRCPSRPESDGKQSPAGKQKLSAISEQGRRFMRMLPVEAAQMTARCGSEFSRQHLHRCDKMPKTADKMAVTQTLPQELATGAVPWRDGAFPMCALQTIK